MLCFILFMHFLTFRLPKSQISENGTLNSILFFIGFQIIMDGTLVFINCEILDIKSCIFLIIFLFNYIFYLMVDLILPAHDSNGN